MKLAMGPRELALVKPERRGAIALGRDRVEELAQIGKRPPGFQVTLVCTEITL
jgi:hypothetical protein